MPLDLWRDFSELGCELAVDVSRCREATRQGRLAIERVIEAVEVIFAFDPRGDTLRRETDVAGFATNLEVRAAEREVATVSCADHAVQAGLPFPAAHAAVVAAARVVANVETVESVDAFLAFVAARRPPSAHSLGRADVGVGGDVWRGVGSGVRSDIGRGHAHPISACLGTVALGARHALRRRHIIVPTTHPRDHENPTQPSVPHDEKGLMVRPKMGTTWLARRWRVGWPPGAEECRITELLGREGRGSFFASSRAMSFFLNRWALYLGVALLVAGGCASESAVSGGDLGTFEELKGDRATEVVEVDFELPADGTSPEFTFVTCGRLSVTTQQFRHMSWERIQLVVNSESYTRRSWRGRSPYVTIPAEMTEGCQEYTLRFKHWGEARAFGRLRVETQRAPQAGVELFYNTPDCFECDDRAGQLRNALIDTIQSATQTLDVAIYGMDDPAIIDAICEAATAGVEVRVLTDETSEAPGRRSYYDALFGYEGVASCGAQVEAVRSYGLMHHKYILSDADSASPTIAVGSTNLTVAGLEENHNHMVVIRGNRDLAQQFKQEVDQLARHCASDRLDDRVCTECSPACTEDRSEEGPFAVDDTTVEAYFSLGDNALNVLRGEARVEMVDAPNPACEADDAECACRASGSRFLCAYCGENGYGLMGEAEERLLVSMYAATDECFGVALKHAARRGVETFAIFDYVKAGSQYSRDNYICEAGIPTYIARWGDRAQVRNHNKIVLVDDAVFTGSLNLSKSGVTENNESTVVLRGERIAGQFNDYLRAEVRLLNHREIAPSDCL